MMINQTKQWLTLTLPLNEQLYDALQQQHHAARNLAILQHSDILQYSSAEKQYKLVKSFFESVIPILHQYLSKDT